MDAKSNFRIKEKLENQGYAEEIIPTGKQLSNRRTYLTQSLLGELAKNTKGGFFQWLNNHEVKFENAKSHDLIIISHQLTKDNFILIVSSQSLLNNAATESINGEGFLALDTTHKLISCQFKFTTITTATINQEMADIAYVIHSNEDSTTFTFALSELKRFLKDTLELEWVINVFLFFLFIHFSSIQ